MGPYMAVAPAVVGSFLERAFDLGDHTELGAHYTKKAYVQRLMDATDHGSVAHGLGAGAICAFGDYDRVRRLCAIRVLHPACGTGK